MGDNIPDFSNMSLEDQMRWLESLAARQGASADEFTTSADMDIPEIDPDSVVIDEPGYVPSETFSFSKHAQPTRPPQPTQQPAPQPAWDEQATEQFTAYDVTQPQAEQPVASAEPDYQSLIDSDPMAFLESLARRQGADASEFMTAANFSVPEIDPNSVVIDEPGYVPSETFSFSKHAQPAQPPQSPTPPAPPAYTPEPEVAPQWSQPEPYQEWQEPVASAEPDYQSLIDSDPMAFLESLARRQGADASEFMTAANFSVPEIDPNSVVIDEPGYVPSETFSFSKHAQPAQPPQPPTPPAPPAYEPEPEPEAPVTEWSQQEVDWYGQQSEYTYTDEQAAAWQQQPTDEAATWQYDYSDQTAWQGDYSYEQPADQQTYQEYQPYQYEDAAAYTYQQQEVSPYQDLSDPELMAESDPMKWLESLAARQGASADEFLTAADLDIPELDPDSVDMSHVGPGYTPYSPFETTPGYAQSVPPTSVPEPPSIPELDFAMEMEMGEMEDFEEAEEGTAEESLAWLQDLALDQGADATDFLNELSPEIPGFDLDFDTTDEESTAAIAAIIQEPQRQEDDFVGMTDEEIARAQVEGTITPEQELAWLMQKAHQLEELHTADVEEEVLPTDEVIEADIPEWIKAQMPSSDDWGAFASEGEMPVLLDDILIPAEDEVSSDWLSVESSDGIEIPPITLEDTSAFETTGGLLAGYDESHDPWVEALAAEASGELDIDAEPDWYKQALEQAEISLEADYTPEPEPAEELEPALFEDPDPTAWYLKAIDEEPVAAATADLPDWLRMSVSDDDSTDAIGDWLRGQELGEAEPEPADWQLAAAAPVANWLDEVREDEEPTPIPTSVVEPPAPVTPKPTPTPVAEPLQQGVEGALPAWHPSQKREPVRTAAQPTPAVSQPVTPPPPPPTPSVVRSAADVRRTAQPTPAPTAPPPAPIGEQFAVYRASLEQNPNDHDTRLKLARDLTKQGSTSDSLKHYETLVENSAMLDTVSTDLVTLASNMPAHPKVRRLLGDVYMRQGRLQEALDTYRGALNQL